MNEIKVRQIALALLRDKCPSSRFFSHASDSSNRRPHDFLQFATARPACSPRRHRPIQDRRHAAMFSTRTQYVGQSCASVVHPIFRGIHQRPKSGISFGSRNAAMTSKRWPTGSPLLRHFENKTQSSGQRAEAKALSSRIGNRAWSALMRRNRSLPFSPGMSKSRTARSKAERSQRNACTGQLSNTTE
jgi:hypothetical protein